MLEHYLQWYRSTLEAFDYPLYNVVYAGDVEKIIVTGMGGSGIVGDMLATIALEFSSLDVRVFKDFYIPRNLIDSNTYVLSISYSGNTLETISSTLISLKGRAKVGIITSGGRLLDLAKSKNLPYAVVRGGLAPRLALPMMLVASIRLLSSCGLEILSLHTLRSSIEVLGKVDEALNLAKSIASLLSEYFTPTIVASTRYQALAFRFKNELNENSKIPAKIEILPELFHNDIVGWEKSKIKDIAILINSDLEYENKLIKFYDDYLQSLGIKTANLTLSGNIVERFLLGSLIAGVTSVYVAQFRGLDPLATHSINKYKNVVKALENEIVEHLEIK
ncbi:MAG: bifunctional phosphoglucose/phosphomannose isomerase [Ignisphaera sp.]|uniref:Bifunctional phosphoglucose/phosphomannose isomerase n=1 Tax=Ignisphaera aggregans TaxID=334771 RepID=A0A7C4JJW1_9CREN